MLMKHNIRYGKDVKIITAIITLVNIAVVIAVGLNLPNLYATYAGTTWGYIILLIAVVYVTVMLYFALRAPRYYILNEEGLTLQLVLGKKTYSAQDYIISDIGNYYQDIMTSIRVMGSGGYFGFCGLFRVRGKGLCNFYITNRNGELFCIQNKRTGKFTYISK